MTSLHTDTAAARRRSSEAAFTVTFFTDQYAKTLKVAELTLAELGERIRTTTKRSKASLPWVKLARFGDLRSDEGSLRHNANVEGINGVEADYDAEQIPFDEAVATIKRAGLKAILYTSPSHRIGAPRWRIALPSSRELPPEEHAKLVARVNGLFDGALGGESFTLSQAYYYGSVNNNPDHRVEIVKGDFIDRRSDLDARAIGKSNSAGVATVAPSDSASTNRDAFEDYASDARGATPERIAAAMAAIPNAADLDRATWIRIGMALKREMPGDDGLQLFRQWSASWQGVEAGKRKRTPEQRDRYTINAWKGFKPHTISAGTLFHLANEATSGLWEPKHEAEQSAAVEPDKRPAGIPAFSNNWCDVTTIPRRKWLYGQHYIRGFATTSIAPGGVGKSTLAINEGICMASGLALLGVPVEEPVKVWYWNGEEPRHEIARRVHAVCEHYKIDPLSIADTFHFTSGLDEFPIKIVTSTSRGITNNEKLFKEIVAFIRDNDIGVMIIDPLISSHAVPENDNSAIDTVAKTWGRIAAITNCNTEMAHHTRKPLRGDEGETLSSDARGAGSLIDAVRASRILNQMSEKEAGDFGVADRFEYFRTNRGKVNMVRRGAASWFKLVSVTIGNGPDNDPDGGDNVQTIEAWTPPDVFEVVTNTHAHAVRAKAASGKYLRDSRSKDNWIGLVVGEVIGLDPVKQRGGIEAIIKSWVDKGILKEVPGKNEKSMPRTFVEPGEWSEQ